MDSLSIAGATLAALLQSCVTQQRPCIGLLFGGCCCACLTVYSPGYRGHAELAACCRSSGVCVVLGCRPCHQGRVLSCSRHSRCVSCTKSSSSTTNDSAACSSPLSAPCKAPHSHTAAPQHRRQLTRLCTVLRNACSGSAHTCAYLGLNSSDRKHHQQLCCLCSIVPGTLTVPAH